MKNLFNERENYEIEKIFFEYANNNYYLNFVKIYFFYFYFF